MDAELHSVATEEVLVLGSVANCVRNPKDNARMIDSLQTAVLAPVSDLCPLHPVGVRIHPLFIPVAPAGYVNISPIRSLRLWAALDKLLDPW